MDNLESEGFYKNDKRDGLYKWYSIHGKLKIEEIWKDSELIDAKNYLEKKSAS